MESILGNTRRADISFFQDGRIEISSRISKILGLSRGDVIDIMKDGREYYLYVRAKAEQLFGQHEAVCYPSQSGGTHFRSWSVRLCRVMLQESHSTNIAKIPCGDIVTINNGLAVSLITCNNLCHDQRD